MRFTTAAIGDPGKINGLKRCQRDAMIAFKKGIDMEENGNHTKLIDEIPKPDMTISMGCDP